MSHGVSQAGHGTKQRYTLHNMPRHHKWHIQQAVERGHLHVEETCAMNTENTKTSLKLTAEEVWGNSDTQWTTVPAYLVCCGVCMSKIVWHHFGTPSDRLACCPGWPLLCALCFLGFKINHDSMGSQSWRMDGWYEGRDFLMSGLSPQGVATHSVCSKPCTITSWCQKSRGVCWWWMQLAWFSIFF